MQATLSKSFAMGNGPSSPTSPVPFWMRQPEWLMLQETRVHQLLMP